MIEVVDERPWRESAACLEVIGEVDFFPSPDDEVSIARAKAVCAACPVIEECGVFALETGQVDGVWGGLTARERLLARRGLSHVRRAS